MNNGKESGSRLEKTEAEWDSAQAHLGVSIPEISLGLRIYMGLVHECPDLC